MRTRTWKMAALLALTAAAFTACDKDDDDYYIASNAWLSYGNLEKIEGGEYSQYAIRRDDGSRLVIVDGVAIRNEKENDGLRVYSRYSILDSERDAVGLEGHMNYYVYLDAIEEVLTKAPVQESFILQDEAHRRDSIGNDPINVNEAWFGGKYLNIEFAVLRKAGSDVAHFINLEQAAERRNDTVYLTLRHNAYSDVPTKSGRRGENNDFGWAWGNVSFDLSGILEEGETSVPVKLLWTAYDLDDLYETETLSDSGLYTPVPRSKALSGDGLNRSRSDRQNAAQQRTQLNCR